ncbi:hypothetical protein CW304_12975 [Bacillus sp. UFRGS-B20]|nr:hypothetical protein CW304_12975 [Bacillus sp. UFRGS-B20]
MKLMFSIEKNLVFVVTDKWAWFNSVWVYRKMGRPLSEVFYYELFSTPVGKFGGGGFIKFSWWFTWCFWGHRLLNALIKD